MKNTKHFGLRQVNIIFYTNVFKGNPTDFEFFPLLGAEAQFFTYMQEIACPDGEANPCCILITSCSLIVDLCISSTVCSVLQVCGHQTFI